MPHCGHHSGECPQESTSEGTFCTISGVELAGPAYIEYDYSRAGNRIQQVTSAKVKAFRKETSLKKRERKKLSPHVWYNALCRLCPKLPEEFARSLSSGLLAWSNKLDLCRKTHPAIRTWPLLFTATVTSHMAEQNETGAGIVPNLAKLSKYCPKHSEYKRFGITCRSMSVTWRAIRGKALSAEGQLVCAFEWKSPVESI